MHLKIKGEAFVVISLIYAELDPGASHYCLLPTHCALMKYTYTYGCHIICTRFTDDRKLLLLQTNASYSDLQKQRKNELIQIMSDLVVFP